ETVHMEVPDAARISSTMRMVGAPPVPRISRDSSFSPATTSGSSSDISTSLYRGEQLDRLSIVEDQLAPAGARGHRAVDRRRDAAVGAQSPGHEIGQCHAVIPLLLLAVHGELHDDASSSVFASRDGLKV